MSHQFGVKNDRFVRIEGARIIAEGPQKHRLRPSGDSATRVAIAGRSTVRIGQIPAISDVNSGRCGREWLKVPYDRLTDRLDLEAELPDDAPEVACRYYRRMYRALTGTKYGAMPLRGWSSGEGRRSM